MTNLEDSNLWNLNTFEKYCTKKGIDYNKIMEKIEDIFIKMIFSVRKKLIKEIKEYKLHSTNFYHLIGIDILFDENLKPYLLEANRRGSVRQGNLAEDEYSHNLIADTINLVGLRIFNREDNTIYGDTKYESYDEEILADSLCELDRPRGGYKLIFPLKKNIEKYKKFYLSDIPIEDKQLWHRLIE